MACGFINGVIFEVPETEPIITDIAKIPGLEKILGWERDTLRNAKRLLIKGRDLGLLARLN